MARGDDPTSRRPRAGRLRPLLLVVGSGLGVVALVAAVAVVLAWTAPQPRSVPGWTAAAGLPVARGEGAGAVVHTEDGPHLAVVGGLTGLGATSAAVTLYDPASDTWRRADALPSPRHHLGVAAIDATLYVTGGAPSARELTTATRQLWALDLDAEGTWQELEPLPQPRWGHRMVAHEGRLYVVGGQPGPDLQIYDPDDGWSTGAPIPEVRDHLGVVVHDDEIWVLGGRDADDRLTARVDVYDPASDAWRGGPDLPAPVSAAAVGVLDGHIHVVDGEDPATLTGGVLDAHWRLGPDDESWGPGPSSRVAVHGAADGVIDDRLYVAGGASRQGALSVLAWSDEVQVLEPDA